MKRLLVTGGAGYIGSVVTKALLDRDYGVTIVDNLSYGHRLAVPRGAQLVVGDVGDPDVLSTVLPNVDAVLHFAALIEVGQSMQHPMTYFSHNVAKTMVLLQAMADYGVKKFIFSSTAALYGVPKRVPISENDALVPTNPYGESKLMVERVLRWLGSQTELRYASLRYFNAAGDGAIRSGQHEETHLIPLVIEVAQGRRSHIQVFGDDYPTADGTAIRDYVHVQDLAQAHILALEALNERKHLTYNLGNGVGFSVQEVIETARHVTGHPIPMVVRPRRDGDPPVLVASSDAIREDLGWVPTFTDFHAIFESAWRWKPAS